MAGEESLRSGAVLARQGVQEQLRGRYFMEQPAPCLQVSGDVRSRLGERNHVDGQLVAWRRIDLRSCFRWSAGARTRTDQQRHNSAIDHADRSVEEALQLDRHAGQRGRLHRAGAVNRLLVASVRLPPPGSQRALVGVNAPDLEVAAPLVFPKLLLDVLVAGRR